MVAPHSPKENHILAALPPAEYERIAPNLEAIPLEQGWALCESRSMQNHVYFPTDSIISLLYLMKDGFSAEIAIAGNEGVVGMALFMGGETTPSRAVVQSAGFSYRLKASLLKPEFERAGAFQYLLLRYTQSLITQMAQTAVCHRLHSLDKQLCRWLLLSLDRLTSNEMLMTQELIADILGVSPERLTDAAGKLRDAGLIQFRQDSITVVDRPGLEARVCECYNVVKHESDRLLSRAKPGERFRSQDSRERRLVASAGFHQMASV